VIIARLELEERALASPLGRCSPVLKLGITLGWLMALAFTYDVRPAAVVAIAALVAGAVLGRVPVGRLAAGLAPLWLMAFGIGLFNALFSASNTAPGAVIVLAFGPLHLSAAGVAAGIGLAARVVAIAAVGVVFGQTTDATQLADSLVQQARAPERFAYGALAAYQAIPRLAEQLMTLRQARRIRGLRSSWHPRMLVGLLVLAIRHGDRLALAMDARGFGSGPRSRFREVRWSVLDASVAAGAIGVVALAVAAALV
jgi:energy-coupling factor transport system permease protein